MVCHCRRGPGSHREPRGEDAIRMRSLLGQRIHPRGGGVFKRALIDGLPLQKGPRESSGIARRGRNTDATPAVGSDSTPGCEVGASSSVSRSTDWHCGGGAGRSPAASVARYANSGQVGRCPSPQTPGQSDFIAPIWMRIPDCTQKRRRATGIKNRPRLLPGSFLHR